MKFAFINAVDAGSTAGLKRILQRLGVGYVEINERLPDRDWDVVLLRLSDSQLSQNPELMRVLIQQYGRTCRRYDFVTITPYHCASSRWTSTTTSKRWSPACRSPHGSQHYPCR